MDFGSLAAKGIDSLSGLFRGWWRAARYGARAELALDWQRPLIYITSGPNPRWRAVRLSVVASKDEEFLIASGSVEARPPDSKRWVLVGDLSDFIRLPITIDRNREWSNDIPGASLAKGIRAHLPHLGLIVLRIVLRDLHRSEVTSKSLAVEITELQREEED